MLNIDDTGPSKQLRKVIYHDILNSACQRISFARFMELALFSADLGYYQYTKNLIGKRGDFVTAPEISTLFSQCLANYCKLIVESLSVYTIVEIGPGTARMAADLLLALERLRHLPKRYVIVEISDLLRQQQKTNLKQWIPHLEDRVEYCAMLPTEPIEGVIIANEVIDALPVHRFGIEKGALFEYYVGYDKKEFVFKKAEPSSERMHNQLKEIQSSYLEGVSAYTSEIRLSLEDWFLQVQACLKKGYIILIDYGKSAKEYYHPTRYAGTLRCYYKHQANTDFLKRVGLQDITSDVDFSQIGRLAMLHGLEVEAFVSQTAFLLVSGLLNFLDCSGEHYLKMKGQIHQLVSPLEMGETSKAMILGRGLDSNQALFQAYDKRFVL